MVMKAEVKKPVKMIINKCFWLGFKCCDQGTSAVWKISLKHLKHVTYSAIIY